MGAVLSPLGVGAPSVVAAFAPTDLAGLVLWLKADSLALNDGDAVASWTDSSGNGNTASQGTAANKPTYKAAIINGKPVVRFDGSSDFLTVTRNAGLEPAQVSIIAVVRAAAAPANSSYAVCKKFTSGSVNSYSLQRSSATLAMRLGCRSGGTFAGTGGTLNDAQLWDGNGHIVVGVVDEGTPLRSNFYTNTNIGAAGLVAGGLNYDANDLTIGSYDGTQLWMAFDLGELLIYNSTLTLGQIGKVVSYLGDSSRWNISV